MIDEIVWTPEQVEAFFHFARKREQVKRRVWRQMKYLAAKNTPKGRTKFAILKVLNLI